MPRGGKRTGSPGKTYSNRSDLNTNRSNVVPMMAAKGQQYGANKAQMDAQRALPIAPPPAPATAPPGGTAGPGAPPAPGPAPMPITPLGAPTQRPGEPVTAGAPVGPGPGVEALGLPDENGVEALAMYLPMLEFIASQPGASSQTRNFVRRLRGAAPIPKVM